MANLKIGDLLYNDDAQSIRYIIDIDEWNDVIVLRYIRKMDSFNQKWPQWEIKQFLNDRTLRHISIKMT